MLGQIVLVAQKWADTAQLQDALATIQNSKLIPRPPDKDERLFFTLAQKARQQISACRSLRQFITGFQVCAGSLFQNKGDAIMEFFNSAVDVLKTLVVALGAGLGVWGTVNLMEGYGGDNPSANAHIR